MQTDKAMYKPGDKVNFRILVLDLNLKPGTIRGDMKVFISVSSIIYFYSKNYEQNKMLMLILQNYYYRTAQTIELNSG